MFLSVCLSIYLYELSSHNCRMSIRLDKPSIIRLDYIYKPSIIRLDYIYKPSIINSKNKLGFFNFNALDAFTMYSKA